MALSTTTTTPTGWAADAAFGNWQRAQSIANQPYQPYQGPLQAGWNEGQRTGYNNVLNGMGVGLPALAQAQQFAAQAAAFQPQQASGTAYQATAPNSVMNTPGYSAGPAQQATAQNFLDANVQDYMNPYIGSVVNTTLGQLGRQNDMLQNQANARAQAAGAFGGSRQAVMNSENNRNFMDTAANTTANLYNTGFNTAQQAISNDQNRAAQTSQFNAGAANQMGQFNAGQMQQAGQATASAHNNMAQFQATAANQAGQFNAEASLRAQLANQQAGLTASQNQLQAANALNGMGLDAQTYALNNANAAFQMGQARTAYDQQSLDNAYNQWAQAQNYPTTQLGILQQGLNGYSSGTAQTQPYYSNTGANILAGTLGAGALGAGILKNGPEIVSGAKSIYNSLFG